MTPLQSKVLDWLANGETGLSSETMAFWLGFGARKKQVNHPVDPSDLDRCLGLLAHAPELRTSLSSMTCLSKEWSALIARWEEIEACHLDEVGLGWSKARRATRTYELMRSTLDPVNFDCGEGKR